MRSKRKNPKFSFVQEKKAKSKKGSIFLVKNARIFLVKNASIFFNKKNKHFFSKKSKHFFNCLYCLEFL